MNKDEILKALNQTLIQANCEHDWVRNGDFIVCSKCKLSRCQPIISDLTKAKVAKQRLKRLEFKQVKPECKHKWHKLNRAVRICRLCDVKERY